MKTNTIQKGVHRIKSILKDSNGVTLIEIMIVVTILAILGALVVPRLMENIKIAKVSAAKKDIGTFSTVLDTYYLLNSTYPTTDEGLKKLVEEGKIKKSADALIDPWNNPYEYRSPGENDTSNEYELWSYGEDGKPGGEGFNADIKSWE